jgi:hypothetical protein
MCERRDRGDPSGARSRWRVGWPETPAPDASATPLKWVAELAGASAADRAKAEAAAVGFLDAGWPVSLSRQVLIHAPVGLPADQARAAAAKLANPAGGLFTDTDGTPLA